MSLRAPIIIGGGKLVEVEKDLVTLPETNIQALRAIMRIALDSDQLRGIAGEYKNLAQLIGKSGHSRIGIDLQQQEGTKMEIEGDHIDVPIIVPSLRGAKDDLVLSEMQNIVAASRGHFEIGRILFANPEQAYDETSVKEIMDQGLLYLAEKANVKKDGLIEIPLENLRYILCEANLGFDNKVRDALTHGKHGLQGIQSCVSEKPEELESGEFFVGGIKIALGKYTAVIERESNQPEVYHLAARILDGMRTTGIDVVRQVEFFNSGKEHIGMKDLKVRIRLYPMPKNKEGKIKFPVTPEKVKRGFEFRDIARLEENPNRIFTLMDEIEQSYGEEEIYARVLAGKRMSEIEWQEEGTEAQDTHTVEMSKRLVANRPEYVTTGKKIPKKFRWLTDSLIFVGREQDQGKVFLSNDFPNADTMGRLLDQDIAVFMAHNLNRPNCAFPDLNEGDTTTHNRPEKRTFNDLNFTGIQYARYKALEERGAKLHMLVNEIADEHVENGKVERHIREFYHGFWVKPEAKERMDKVDTVVALYGSHVKGLDPIMEKQLSGFMKRMKKIFGEQFAITHGKGPGVMRTADKIAEEQNIFRFGVGLDLEQKQGQEGNYTPEAMLDFQDTERLPRQTVMDDISTFKIFNVGGAGTLEEAAITLCSQKLEKNIITPIIFVDPVGINNGEHIFEHFKKLIEIMATKNHISKTEAHTAIENIQLLSTSASKYCHFVKSYDEAADIIEKFKTNQVDYYKETGIGSESVVCSLNNQRSTNEKTGFRIPSWYDETKILDGLAT